MHTRSLKAFLLSSLLLVRTSAAAGNDPLTSRARLDAVGIPRALYNVGFKPEASAPDDVARAYLDHAQDELRISGGASALHIQSIQTSDAGSHVRFAQRHGGIPVYQGDVVVSTNALDGVSMVINNFKADIRLSSTTPRLTPAGAIRAASTAIRQQSKTIGSEHPTLMVFRGDDGSDHLVYRVLIVTEKPSGAWEVLVDARSGDILKTGNRAVGRGNGDRVQGHGWVYLSDPLSAAHRRYGDPGFSDNNDADSDSLTAHRMLVTLDSLTEEQGVYALRGPSCTITDIETPWDPPAYVASNPDGFQYTRSQPGFEAVNAFYHVTSAYQRMASLGFSSSSLRQLRVDPHGLGGEDNSHYVPEENYIAFGTGGVDDAEDAEVIWHEYGHAIQYNLIPEWGGNYECAALGEGFADYWAASYSRSLGQWSPSDREYNYLFKWNAHNPFLLGRVLNYGGTYPFMGRDCYLDGQIWSSVLLAIQDELGRDVTDRLVLQSFMYLGSNATAPDNAHAIIQADRDLYSGAHCETLAFWLGTVKHFINPADVVPSITHSPLPDTDDPRGPFTVRAYIDARRTLASAMVVWGNAGSCTDSIPLIPTRVLNEYTAQLPGSPDVRNIRYTIVVRDSAGITVTSPRNATLRCYSFQAGIDSTPPALEHEPLTRVSIHTWPPRIHASVSDNLCVDSVWVEFWRNGQLRPSAFALPRASSVAYTGVFPLPLSSVKPGDSLFYRVVAQDGSKRHNRSFLPATGSTAFIVTEEKAEVLIVDAGLPSQQYAGTDQPNTNHMSGKPTVSWAAHAAETIQGATFNVTTVAFDRMDERNLSKYAAIVLIGGTNPAPFSDAAKRGAITSYVRNGGKILVEGGFVARFYSPGGGTEEVDRDFRTVVLHAASSGETCGAAVLTPTDGQSPLFSRPNRIEGDIEFVPGSGLPDRAAVVVPSNEAGTSAAAIWSQKLQSAGIVMHEQELSKAQTLFFAFSTTAIADAGVAARLFQNAIILLAGSSQAPGSSTHAVERTPTEFLLGQNYPNPFNPATSIPFSLPEPGYVRLRIYNVLGQEIALLVDEQREAGSHQVSWNAANAHSLSAASGVYLYRLEVRTDAGQHTRVEQRKMLLLH